MSVPDEIRDILREAAEGTNATLIELDDKLYFQHACGNPLKFGFLGIQCDTCKQRMSWEIDANSDKVLGLLSIIHPKCRNPMLAQRLRDSHYP